MKRTIDEEIGKAKYDLGILYPGINIVIDIFAVMPDKTEIEADTFLDLIEKLEEIYP
jgi:hypothetical protein